MHEFGIMESVFETAEIKLHEAGGTRIHRLKLRIGKLSGVAPEALSFAFNALRERTPAANAVLEIEEVPIVCRCAHCSLDFEVPDLKYQCPRCRQSSGELRCGNEMESASLEIS